MKEIKIKDLKAQILSLKTKLEEDNKTVMSKIKMIEESMRDL